MKKANDLVIYEVVIKQNLRAFLDISANIEREEGKQFVMRVRGYGDGPQKTSQRALRLTHSN